ncbi:MAG: hypothetical protein AAFQ40_00120 [Cyanobacteria bacterium J06623_5]
MLTAPAFRTINGVTIFRDNNIWYRFYPIAPHPSIRLDEQQNPVFLLVKYAFSDQDREDNPDLPAGGGYVNFDIQFDVSDNDLETVRSELQSWVDAEWQRLKQGTPEERKLPAVSGSEPPLVEFGTPTWTTGAVAMDAPQSEDLVSSRVVEGAPSLLSGNIAVFSMDLTSRGANFMEEVLIGAEGSGPGDLTPIQVRYDLGFWAQLPPVRIHVKAESEKIYEQTRKIMDGRGIDHCTTYDFAHSDIDTHTASVAGLIDVQIDTGSASLDDEVIEELRRYSLEMIQQMIETSFFTEDPNLGINTDEADPTPNLTKPHRGSRRRRRNTKKYLKKTFDQATMTLELTLEQRSVINWNIHPQATLETFFSGIPPAELKNYVRVIDLDTSDFFKTLNLTITPFVDFEDPVISALEVQVRYRGRDENNNQQEKLETFTFTDAQSETWKPSLIGGNREYEYRYRLSFKDRGFTPYTDWEASKSPDLNLPQNPYGYRIKAAILAGNINFADLVEQVQVTLAYEDAEANIPRQERSVLLTASEHEATYERLIYDFQNQPLKYHSRFTLKSGEVIEQDWQETVNSQIVINQPFEKVLDVVLQPTGNGWADVARVMVDLRYQDAANQYLVEESLSLKAIEELKTWQVVLRDKSKRDFEYKVTASFKDGRFEQTDWKPYKDATLPIEIKAPPQLKVTLIGDLLDFEASPLTEVTLWYDAAGEAQSETFVFRDKVPQTWILKLPESSPIDYTYQVTHYPPGGDPVVLAKQREKDSALTLLPYNPPKAGELKIDVLAQLIDFSQTPLVVVDLAYEDDLKGTRLTESLAFNTADRQTWTIAVGDINQKLYSYQITYYPADGEPQTSEAQFQDRNLLIIPKFQAD